MGRTLVCAAVLAIAGPTGTFAAETPLTEAAGELIEIPAGASMRVGVKSPEGTTWLKAPAANAGVDVRTVYHRLFRIRGKRAYVKLAGIELAGAPVKLGAKEIRSGGVVTLNVTVSADGKTAVTDEAGTIRLHPVFSIPNNRPFDEQPTKRELLNHLKGKRVTIKGFAFNDRAGKPTDLFLDEVRAVAVTPTQLLSRPDMKTGKREALHDVPGAAEVWVTDLQARYARARYRTRNQANLVVSNGGWIRQPHLKFAVPKPKADPTASGASKALEQLSD